MFNRASVLGEKNFLPPPLATLRRGKNVSLDHMLACTVLVPDLAHRNCHFEQIIIRTSDRSVLGPGKDILELPGMTPIAFRLATAQDPEPTPLRKLHLQYTLEHMDALDSFATAFMPISLAGMWQGAANLHELDLEIRVHVASPGNNIELTCCMPLRRIFGAVAFPRLTVLNLRSMWLEPADLSAFLKKHRRMLQHVTLRDLNLGDTEGSVRPYPDDKPWIVALHIHLSQANVTLLGASSWSDVIEVCQSMGCLRGLAISGASIDRSWNTLSEDVMDDLVKLGMNGRANELAVPHWSSIWE